MSTAAAPSIRSLQLRIFLSDPEKMDDLATKTADISINEPPHQTAHTIVSFSPVILSHLEKVYGSLAASKSEFLHSIQHESKTGESSDPLASLAQFQAYMASPASSALSPASKGQFSAPMTDYFISSSHNTYLTGNQLYSDSDASSYAAVGLSPFSSVVCVEKYGSVELQWMTRVAMLTQQAVADSVARSFSTAVDALRLMSGTESRIPPTTNPAVVAVAMMRVVQFVVNPKPPKKASSSGPGARRKP